MTLAELGAPGLRIDRLSTRLGLTKGSFYHHFDGIIGYKHDLLAHFERQCTTAVIDVVEDDPLLDAVGRLRRLMNVVLSDVQDKLAQLEVAMRAWALQDPDAHAVQARVDATRLVYLRRLCQQVCADRRVARDVAQMMYLLLVGAGHVVPPASVAELRRLWRRAVALLGADAA